MELRIDTIRQEKELREKIILNIKNILLENNLQSFQFSAFLEVPLDMVVFDSQGYPFNSTISSLRIIENGLEIETENGSKVYTECDYTPIELLNTILSTIHIQMFEKYLLRAIKATAGLARQDGVNRIYFDSSSYDSSNQIPRLYINDKPETVEYIKFEKEGDEIKICTNYDTYILNLKANGRTPENIEQSLFSLGMEELVEKAYHQLPSSKNEIYEIFVEEY